MSLNVQNFTPAFVLHTRPFSETSMLVEFFTHDFGRVSAVARGVKRKHSKLAGILMPFVPLSITFKGKTDLVTLYRAESTAVPYYLQESALFCGLYINELLLRLLAKHDTHAELFECYQNILQELASIQSPKSKWQQRCALSLFEKQLLQEIGYGLELSKTVAGTVIAPDMYYTFKAGTGIIEAVEQQNYSKQKGMTCHLVSGKSLLALQAGNITTAADLMAAEYLLAQVFCFLLGEKYLRSRRMLGFYADAL